MSLPSFQSICLSKKLIANKVYELTFSKPDNWSFTSGQYVMWDVPTLEDASDIQPRAYSIASQPSDDELLFVIRLEDGGRASMWAEQQLNVGSQVRMQGPLGNLHMDIGSPKDCLFVCTSTGNAPFRPMILDALAADSTRRMDLVFGVRSQEDLYWVDDFKYLARSNPNFYFHPTLSQPDEDWKGHKGRVQVLFHELSKDTENKKIYACGNPEMTKEIKRYCLEELDMEKKDVHIEGYI